MNFLRIYTQGFLLLLALYHSRLSVYHYLSISLSDSCILGRESGIYVKLSMLRVEPRDTINFGLLAVGQRENDVKHFIDLAGGSSRPVTPKSPPEMMDSPLKGHMSIKSGRKLKT